MRLPALVLILFSISAAALPLQTEEPLRIISPASGDTVHGNVEILGTASVPGLLRYRVEFAYEPNPTDTWFLITEAANPIQDGLLAVWDTTRISDGSYTLRIVAFFPDGSTRDANNPGIQVLQTASITSVLSTEMIIGSTPEPVIQNRAVAAIFPAPTAVIAENFSTSADSTSRMGIAFISGAGAVFLGFGFFWIRSRWRWWKHRQYILQIRKSESKHE
jgi:hypothetical protein